MDSGRYLHIDKEKIRSFCEFLGHIAAIGMPISVYFKIIPFIFISFIGYVGFHGGRIYLDYKLKYRTDESLKKAIDEILRQLYFQFFDKEAGHRITLFHVDKHNFTRIIPTNRWAYGSGAECDSKAWFAKGTGFAGLAWESPGQVFLKINIPETHSVEEFIRVWGSESKITREQVNSLSDYTLRNVRSLYSIGFVNTLGISVGALCIDSKELDPFSSKGFSQIEVDKTCSLISNILSIKA